MQQSAERQLLQIQELSVRLTQARQMEDSLMVTTPYAVQDTGNRFAYPTQNSSPSRARPQRLSLPVFLATSISVAAILLSLLICKTLFTRRQFSGVTRRRLSEADKDIDEDERSIVEGCLDLEEELGVIEGRAISSSEADSLNRVTALVSMLSEAAAAKESMQEPRPVDGQLHLTQQLLEKSSVFEPQNIALLGLNSPLQPSVEFPGPAGGAPALDPDSWIDLIPSISDQPEGQEAAESFQVSDDDSEAGQASGSPASKRRRLRGLSHLLDDVQSHPYVRLPVLEKGVVPKSIQISRLFSQRRRGSSFYFYLLGMRDLLARKTLTQHGADLLVQFVEDLVRVSYRRAQRSNRHPFPIRVVEYLGEYFIAFDAIVCAIELLGECMQLPLWWEQFTAGFNIDYSLPFLPTGGNRKSRFLTDLARRLAAALKIYKTGRRPPLREVISLKKLLFCHPLGQHQFKHDKWDPWRHDGGKF
ncbi:hypothetical protein EBH_0075890 [Eimeria brunetti]|uniref:Uncharacterized protein n=1 Tax=Eimeria brunetti TaxID=51314 RepID=U6LVA8_9EIME|nr:hypothetical protein EBH_0075890 [Eimeria brunetti]